MKSRSLSPTLFSVLNAQLDGALQEFKKLDLGEKRSDYLSSMPIDVKGPHYPCLYLPDSEEDYDLPDSGKATVEYKVTRRSKQTVDGKTRHNATVEIKSLEPVSGKDKGTGGPGDKGKKGEVAKMLSQIQASLNEFAGYGERPRSKNGTFVADETGGADPVSMRQAYAPAPMMPAAQPGRLKPMMVGAALGAGAMSKRVRRTVGRGARGAMRAVTG